MGSLLGSLVTLLDLVTRLIKQWEQHQLRKQIANEVQIELRKDRDRKEERANEARETARNNFDPDNPPEWMRRYQRDR